MNMLTLCSKKALIYDVMPFKACDDMVPIDSPELSRIIRLSVAENACEATLAALSGGLHSRMTSTCIDASKALS